MKRLPRNIGTDIFCGAMVSVALLLLAAVSGNAPATAHISPPLMQPIRTEARTITATDYLVERIIDGRTFVITYDGCDTDVRIVGLDEHADPAALARLIGGRVVRIKPVDPAYKRDGQGRLLCRVQLIDLVDVTDWMRESR